MKHIPALDGLRALAVLAVIAFHTHVPGMGWGILGVEAFFVLSGFLITSILLRQHEAGGIRLGQFYLRRARRLYPALIVMVGLYLLAASAWGLWPDVRHGQDALIALTYLSDYGTAFWHRPEVLRHTWSLSVEEHFYMLWPLAVPWIATRKRPLQWMVALFVLATLWRCVSWELIGHLQTSRFDSRTSGLMLGAVLAFLPDLSRVAWGRVVIYAGLLTAYTWGGPWLRPLNVTAIEVATAALVLLIAYGRAPKLLEHPWLVYVGKISYGLYLYHYIIVRCLLTQGDLSWQTLTIVTLVATFALSIASYHTVEAWFRNPKPSAGFPRAAALDPGARP